MLSRLNCGFQQYDWGKLGAQSRVAKYARTNTDTIRDDEPYAELWMGTHPKMCSTLIPSGASLRAEIEAHPEYMGDALIEKYGPGELPFLFKVLSIRKPLSIQAHPDKALAKQLRASDPKNYPDDNHKPEMAIALTPFEGFCGFRPVNEIAWFLDHVPEFAELVGDGVVKQFKHTMHTDSHKALHVLFNAVMTADDLLIEEMAKRLVERATLEGANFAGSADFGGAKLASLLVRCNNDFPLDVGLFCGGLMLNYVELNAGEAMFLAAKVPHAYISGDIVECMAASDNVVRSGFTPKFKDVKNLVAMLTYDSGPADEQKMKPLSDDHVIGGEVKLFNPPIDEFVLLEHKADQKSVFKPREGPAIFITTEGTGELIYKNKTLEYAPGFVFFAARGTEFTLVPKTATTSYHAVADK